MYKYIWSHKRIQGQTLRLLESVYGLIKYSNLLLILEKTNLQGNRIMNKLFSFYGPCRSQGHFTKKQSYILYFPKYIHKRKRKLSSCAIILQEYVLFHARDISSYGNSIP